MRWNRPTKTFGPVVLVQVPFPRGPPHPTSPRLRLLSVLRPSPDPSNEPLSLLSPLLSEQSGPGRRHSQKRVRVDPLQRNSPCNVTEGVDYT